MRLVALFVLLMAAACGTNPHTGTKYPTDGPPREILLGVGDLLAVNVWEQKDLTTEVMVRPDGTITIPLVGDLQAKNKTPSQVRDDIKKALTNFLKLQAGNEVVVAV